MSKQRIWVLLRGLVREKRHWEGFPDTLQTYLPDDKFILYDFPGNGQRYKEKSATSITGMVEDLRAFLTDSSVQQPVHIIALSLGGMAAIEWIDKYPDECAAAVLISTSLRGLNPFYQRLLPANYAAILKSLLLPGSVLMHESTNMRLVSNIVANDNQKSVATLEHWVSYAEQYPVSGINGLRQLLAATTFHVPENQPKVPTLVLRSLADHLVSPHCSRTLSDHWNLPMASHDTAGHDIPLDDGPWVCEKIIDWLQTS